MPGFAEVRVRSTGERRGNVLPVRPPYNEEKDQGAKDRYARARGLLPYRNFKDLVGLRALLVLLIDRHSVSDDQRDGDQAKDGGSKGLRLSVQAPPGTAQPDKVRADTDSPAELAAGIA